MAQVMNNTVRLINIGAAMCIPGMVTEIADHWMTNGRVVELMADGDLSDGAAPPPARQPRPGQPPARPGAPRPAPAPPSPRPAPTPPVAAPQPSNPPMMEAKPAPRG